MEMKRSKLFFARTNSSTVYFKKHEKVSISYDGERLHIYPEKFPDEAPWHTSSVFSMKVENDITGTHVTVETRNSTYWFDSVPEVRQEVPGHGNPANEHKSIRQMMRDAFMK